MAESLPKINFGFEELRDRMAQFTTKFDDFIETGRKRVLEERNQFRMNVAELRGVYQFPLIDEVILTQERSLTLRARGPAHEEEGH
jgi:kinetochore protein Spc25, fungi type